MRFWRRGLLLSLKPLAKRPFGTGEEEAARVSPASLVEVTESPIKNVKILAMKNPVENVLSASLISELLTAISKLCNPDKGVCRGIVLTSALSNGCFSAGLDLDVLHTNLDREIFFSYWRQLQKLYITLNTLPVPLVAAINGDAFGAGCVIALASDYRVMAERAEGEGGGSLRIGITATKRGFVIPQFFAALVAHVVGHRRCEALLQLGEPVTADTARSIGLVDETVENADEVLVAALQMAERLSELTPWCYWLVKDISRRKLVAPLCTPALREADCFNFYEMLCNPDVRRDLGAYIASNKQTGVIH